jgi:thymidylate synthase
MTRVPVPDAEPANQLWEIVERIRNENVRALNKFELSIFDPGRDVDESPYGGQCLSFLSFKLIPGATKSLTLTAIYRNHFYIEKLLGNLIGLGRLMSFVAQEGGVSVGPLTVVSTHAEIDQPGGARRSDIGTLITKFDQAETAPVAA